MRSPLCRFALLLATALVAAPLAAQDQPAPEGPTLAEKETARSMFVAGDELYQQGKYQEALEKFVGADDIMNLPTTKLERGRTLMMLGRLLEARDALVQVGLIPRPAVESEVQRQARVDAESLAAEVAGRIPTLRVEVRGVEDDTPVVVSLDGAEVNRAAILHGVKVDPGKRLVRAQAEGFVTRERLVAVGERDERVVTMTMRAADVEAPLAPAPAPVAPPPPPPAADDTAWTVVGWTGLTVGVLGLAQGIVLGVITLGEESDLAEACPGQVCPPEQRAAFDNTRTLAHVSTASFVIGGVGLALGITGLVIAASEDGDSTVGLSLGPGSAGITGAF